MNLKTKAGRKPLDPSGEPMRIRTIRMTDKQYADSKVVGQPRIRAYITRTAAKIKATTKPPKEQA